VWKREVGLSYNTMEHFLVETGRGAGWHRFSALSTPVLIWFNAYFKPGRLTVGLDGWVRRQEWAKDNREVRAELVFAATGESVILVAGAGRQRASVNAQPARTRWLRPGLLEVVVSHAVGQPCTVEAG
jgi:hypothetical protein